MLYWTFEPGPTRAEMKYVPIRLTNEISCIRLSKKEKKICVPSLYKRLTYEPVDLLYRPQVDNLGQPLTVQALGVPPDGAEVVPSMT